MLIDAPFTIGVIDNEETRSRELHLKFTDAFCAKPDAQRAGLLRQYIDGLQEDINKLDDGNPNKAGMLTIQQISQELLPHIVNDEIPLSETIVIEIRQDNVLGNLIQGNPVQ